MTNADPFYMMSRAIELFRGCEGWTEYQRCFPCMHRGRAFIGNGPGAVSLPATPSMRLLLRNEELEKFAGPTAALDLPSAQVFWADYDALAQWAGTICCGCWTGSDCGPAPGDPSCFGKRIRWVGDFDDQTALLEGRKVSRWLVAGLLHIHRAPTIEVRMVDDPYGPISLQWGDVRAWLMPCVDEPPQDAPAFHLRPMAQS